MRRLLRVAGRRAAIPRWTVLAGIASALVLVAVLLLVIVDLPQLAIDPRGLSRADWLKAVQDLRTTILQGLGGLAVLFGYVVAVLNLRETSRQNRALLEVQRRGQTTERFTRAIEQLGQPGSEKLDVRIGAAYALEQIARDSAELHWPIMEVLTAYLREHASARARRRNARSASGWRLPADHQAIATVIGRRRRLQDPEGERLDLHGTDLAGLRWSRAHLERADLSEAHLERADLSEAHLEAAGFQQAQLEEARLIEAHLEGTALDGAHLERAWLRGAHLEGAWLSGAHLEGANLFGAHLEGAWLRGAHLEGANLAGAHLERAKLSREQAAWLGPASATEASAAGSEGGPEASGGAAPDRR